MCLLHILCRAQNMLQGAETTRLWITSQQLNEHMTERHKIKNPCITQVGPELAFLHIRTAAFGSSESGSQEDVNTAQIYSRTDLAASDSIFNNYQGGWKIV